MIIELRPMFKAGGLIHTAFHLYFIRFHLWVDLLGSELIVADITGKVNISTYSDACLKINALNENFRFKLNA